MIDTPKKPFAALYDDLKAGQLSRREFTMRALALGVGMPIVSFVLRADIARASGARTVGFGVAAQGTTGAPAEGMDGRTRGEGGELRLIQWQAQACSAPTSPPAPRSTWRRRSSWNR